MTKYNIISRLLYGYYFILVLTSSAHSTDWYTNEDMTTLYEGIDKVSSESIYVDTNIDLPIDILKQYIYKIDPYGDYFTKEEYSAFHKTLSPHYFGVGMILYQQSRDAKMLCIPMSQQSKDLGVSKYDELLSVNGHSVLNRNFYLVSSWFRGKKNSKVIFKIKTLSGKTKTIVIKRKEQFFQTAQRIIEEGIPMIQIIRFTSETAHELRSILQKWPKNIPIIIDLRGNGGGGYFAAIHSADLFLPKNTFISTIETKNKHNEYKSLNKDMTCGRKVVLLQDRYSASAAEVFIAALTQNNRAQSIGEKSFGKAVAQKFIPLSSGGALLLTYGKIITPNGENYHKKGLLPTSSLSLGAFLKSSI